MRIERLIELRFSELVPDNFSNPYLYMHRCTDEILSKGGVQTFLTFDASVNNAVWRAIPYRSLVLVGQSL